MPIYIRSKGQAGELGAASSPSQGFRVACLGYLANEPLLLSEMQAYKHTGIRAAFSSSRLYPQINCPACFSDLPNRKISYLV